MASTPDIGSNIKIPTINPPQKQDYAAIYSQAQSQIAPNADAAISTLTPLPGQIRQDAGNIAKTYTSEIPIVTNIYSDLAKNLQIKYGEQIDSERSQQQQAVGNQKAAAAKSGFDSTQGYQAAIVGNIEKSYNTQIQSTLDQYGVQSDQLMQEASKGISDLVAEAQQAIMQGDTTAADITTKIVGFKMQEQQMITDAANNILSAQTQDQKAYWQQTYQSAILDIRQQTLDLSAQKLQYTESKGSGGGGKIDVSKLTSYGSTVGLSQQDIQNAIDYGTQNGLSQNQIQRIMLDASNKSSSAASSNSNNQTSGGGIMNTIGNDISAAWKWLTGFGK
jgi:hypothetical protein